MKNKWLIALAAVGIHMSIGSVYAFSVLTRPLMAEFGFTLAETTWTFSLAILFLGLSAGLLGTLVENVGPKVSGLISAAFFTTGLLGSALAVHLGSLWLLYLSYGVIGGIGLGVGYVTPVSTLVKYFPRHRGFATGLAIMGFGFASFIASPLMVFLIEHVGLVGNFLVLAALYGTVMVLSASYLAPPKEDSFVELAEHAVARTRLIQHQVSANAALRTWRFYALWWIFFVNISCGIALLAVASPMAQEVAGMSVEGAAAMVGVIGLVNGAGRILWSSASDWLGRGATYVLFFILEVGAFHLLSSTTGLMAFQILVLLIVSCYGGGFACMPAYISDLFGVKHLSAIHGRILTAWGFAGIAGPFLLSFLKEHTEGYAASLEVFAGLFVVNILISAALWKSLKKRNRAISEAAAAVAAADTHTSVAADRQTAAA